MWPLDQHASDVLKLPGETDLPWAVFDAGWYRRNYPDAIGQDAPAILQYYLTTGQRRGHSPNRMFDEPWHRQMYPAITQRMEAGHYASAFDAYCRRGALDRSAHWLFDELAYRDRYPDLTNEVFEAAQVVNGYDHYLRHGINEDRIGHMLFDPSTYLANFDPADVAAIRRSGVFQHYLNRIESNEPELRTSIYFDPDWYLQRYPDVAKEIADRRWTCALHHYLCNNDPTAFDPSASFSEHDYLRRDPGLLAVIESGHFRNGYAHFLHFGIRELRPPCVAIDLAWYAQQPKVRSDLQQGLAANAFAHWLTIGVPGNLPTTPPPAERVTAAQARSLMHQSAVAQLPLAGRFGYRFDCQSDPLISVVLVVRDGFAATMATIASLRANTVARIELIIIDCGSRDETRFIGRYLPGARITRFDSDLDWSHAANAGRQLSQAPIILFLSPEVQLAAGAVDHAFTRLANDPKAGAVGGLILQPHGVISQAGGILWNDGGTHDYKRGASALAPEANFVRQVDFCGPGFLMLKASAIQMGFDHNCDGYYPVIDLCLQLTEAGYTVVYDPAIQVIDANPVQLTQGGGQHFMQKHASLLAARSAPGGPVQVFARHAGLHPARILFIEDTIPLRRTGSGFVRSNDIVHAMAALGYAVTVFPVNGSSHDAAAVFHDMPDTAEVMHTHSIDDLPAFLEARATYYDIIWVARTHNLARLRPILAKLSETPRVILDTEAVTPYREAIQARLAGHDYDLDAAMQDIRNDAGICESVVAVTPAEAATLHRHGFSDVSVLGHMIHIRPSARPFEQRAGMLFVGAIHKQDSPNMDSLTWFVDAVLPLIEAELKWETRLTIAGYVAPDIDLSHFENHSRITLAGPRPDLDPLYNANRVFVAPTRFAAGAPYKVLEAASRGLPVIASTLLCEELGWRSGQDIIGVGTYDPAAFASAVVMLYRDAELWQAVQAGALQRLGQDHTAAEFKVALARILSASVA